jgi:hypothetical protein
MIPASARRLAIAEQPGRDSSQFEYTFYWGVLQKDCGENPQSFAFVMIHSG